MPFIFLTLRLNTVHISGWLSTHFDRVDKSILEIHFSHFYSTLASEYQLIYVSCIFPLIQTQHELQEILCSTTSKSCGLFHEMLIWLNHKHLHILTLSVSSSGLKYYKVQLGQFLWCTIQRLIQLWGPCSPSHSASTEVHLVSRFRFHWIKCIYSSGSNQKPIAIELYSWSFSKSKQPHDSTRSFQPISETLIYQEIPRNKMLNKST